jgi:hypothetical protein
LSCLNGSGQPTVQAPTPGRCYTRNGSLMKQRIVLLVQRRIAWAQGMWGSLSLGCAPLEEYGEGCTTVNILPIAERRPTKLCDFGFTGSFAATSVMYVCLPCGGSCVDIELLWPLACLHLALDLRVYGPSFLDQFLFLCCCICQISISSISQVWINFPFRLPAQSSKGIYHDDKNGRWLIVSVHQEPRKPKVTNLSRPSTPVSCSFSLSFLLFFCKAWVRVIVVSQHPLIVRPLLLMPAN